MGNGDGTPEGGSSVVPQFYLNTLQGYYATTSLSSEVPFVISLTLGLHGLCEEKPKRGVWYS